MNKSLLKTTNNPQGTIPQVLRGGREKLYAWHEAVPPSPADAPPAAVPGLQVPFGLNFSNSGADQLHTYWYGERHKV